VLKWVLKSEGAIIQSCFMNNHFISGSSIAIKIKEQNVIYSEHSFRLLGELDLHSYKH
jgi:hypothetical protein